MEMSAACIFTIANLICKDGWRFGFSPVTENQKAKGMFGIFTIAITLCAMIYMAGPHTGAAVNPAVSISNHAISVKLFAAGTVKDDFVCTYLMGGILGGILGGFYSVLHGWFVNKDFAKEDEPKDNMPIKQDEEAAKGE